MRWSRWGTTSPARGTVTREGDPSGSSSARSRSRSPGSVAAGDPPGVAGPLPDVQSGVGPVGQINVAALVGLDVVGLDRHLAAPRSVRHTALRRPLGRRRDIERGVAGRIGIANIHAPHTTVEGAEDNDLPAE